MSHFVFQFPQSLLGNTTSLAENSNVGEEGSRALRPSDACTVSRIHSVDDRSASDAQPSHGGHEYSTEVTHRTDENSDQAAAIASDLHELFAHTQQHNASDSEDEVVFDHYFGVEPIDVPVMTVEDQRTVDELSATSERPVAYLFQYDVDAVRSRRRSSRRTVSNNTVSQTMPEEVRMRTIALLERNDIDIVVLPACHIGAMCIGCPSCDALRF